MNFSGKIVDLLCESKQKRQFNRLLQGRYQRLYRLAFSWSHQAMMAEDLVQDTMLKAIEKHKDLNNWEQLDAWLCKIMHNNFLDNVRYNTRWEWVDEAVIDDHCVMECSEEALMKAQNCERIYMAMAKLPFAQREAITLADLQGFSYQEISDITDTPIGTVMSPISRGRERLKELLEMTMMEPKKVVPLRRK